MEFCKKTPRPMHGESMRKAQNNSGLILPSISLTGKLPWWAFKIDHPTNSKDIPRIPSVSCFLSLPTLWNRTSRAEIGSRVSLKQKESHILCLFDILFFFLSFVIFHLSFSAKALWFKSYMQDSKVITASSKI